MEQEQTMKQWNAGPKRAAPNQSEEALPGESRAAAEQLEKLVVRRQKNGSRMDEDARRHDDELYSRKERPSSFLP